MKKTFFAVSIVSILVISSTGLNFHSDTVYANAKINSLNSQKQEIQKKKEEINTNIENKNQEIKKVESEKKDLSTEIQRISVTISDTENKIAEKKREIAETEKEISILKEEIEILKDRINKRNELLKNRARSYQENGQINYLSVLFGAQSFGDFIDRLGAVATIIEADNDILREHQKDKEELEKKQAEVEEKLRNLQKMKDDLEKMKENLSAQKSEKEKLVAELEKQQIEIEKEVMDLEEVNTVLAAQEAAIQKAIELEKKRIEEEKRRQEEERKRAEAAARAQAAAKSQSSGQNASGQSGSKKQSNNNSNYQAPPVSGGNFTNPAPGGYLTSGFRPAHRPNHHGIDIGSGGRAIPIVAAADGVVIQSYVSSSYGECVMITHRINGSTYTTVYAHLRSGSRTVSNGQVVRKGQIIGYMGNTGRSSGVHLHFELHRGSWNKSKSNAVNPIGIIPF